MSTWTVFGCAESTFIYTFPKPSDFGKARHSDSGLISLSTCNTVFHGDFWKAS